MYVVSVGIGIGSEYLTLFLRNGVATSLEAIYSRRGCPVKSLI